MGFVGSGSFPEGGAPGLGAGEQCFVTDPTFEGIPGGFAVGVLAKDVDQLFG
jgi:hypothetical protein